MISQLNKVEQGIIMPNTENDTSSLELVSKLVSAYVSNNSLPPSEIPHLIMTVHEALKSPDQTASSRPEPAVPIKKSVTRNYVICLEDGKKLKMLKRHLRTAFDMSPDEYRQRWGLPGDYRSPAEPPRQATSCPGSCP